MFQVARRDAPKFDAFTLRDGAEANEPHAAVDFFLLGRAPEEPFVVFAAPKTDPATGKPYDLPFDQMFLDPYTGATIGVRDAREVTLGRRGVVSFLYRLHYALARRSASPASISGGRSKSRATGGAWSSQRAIELRRIPVGRGQDQFTIKEFAVVARPMIPRARAARRVSSVDADA